MWFAGERGDSRTTAGFVQTGSRWQDLYQNDKYFNKLYVEMAAANGFHSFAFVDPGWDVIVTVDVPDKREVSISYYEFDAPGAK